MSWDRISLGELKDIFIIRNGMLMTHRYANYMLIHHVVPYTAATGDCFLLIHDNAKLHIA